MYGKTKLINVLPLKDPIIKTFLHDAYPLSIMANNDQYLSWFYSNYIQLSFNKEELINENILFLVFEEFRGAIKSPWLKCQTMYWNVLSRIDLNMIDFITTQIDLGYYVYLNLNDYFVPHRPQYKKYHFTHDNLIYGYNRKEKNFNIAGYNELGIYSQTEVSFREFKDAFYNVHYDPKVNDEWLNQVFFLQYNSEANYEFDPNLVFVLLKDYIFSKNYSKRHNEYKSPATNRIYGMDIYNYLLEQLEFTLDNNLHFDIRPLYILWEHKKCMLLRLEYMQANGFLNYPEGYERYKLIEEKSNKCRNLMLKFGLTQNEDSVKKTIQLLNEILSEEKEVLMIVLIHLKNFLAGKK